MFNKLQHKIFHLYLMAFAFERFFGQLQKLALSADPNPLSSSVPVSHQGQESRGDFCALLVGQLLNPLVASLLHQLPRQRRQLRGVDVVPEMFLVSAFVFLRGLKLNNLECI